MTISAIIGCFCDIWGSCDDRLRWVHPFKSGTASFSEKPYLILERNKPYPSKRSPESQGDKRERGGGEGVIFVLDNGRLIVHSRVSKHQMVIRCIIFSMGNSNFRGIKRLDCAITLTVSTGAD